MKEEKREQLTTSETIDLKRKGSSDYLRVPATWRASIKGLQGKLKFEAKVERDENGILYIIFKKVKNSCHP